MLTDGRTPFIPAATAGTGKTGWRLAFARWLTRPDHPPTARVMVNRIWKHHFERGIVWTKEEFGASVLNRRLGHRGLPVQNPKCGNTLAPLLGYCKLLQFVVNVRLYYQRKRGRLAKKWTVRNQF